MLDSLAAQGFAMRNATVIISSESRILMMLANHHASPFGKRTCKSRPKLGMESCPLLALMNIDSLCGIFRQAWHGIVPPVGTAVPWKPRTAGGGQAWHGIVPPVGTLSRCHAIAGDNPSLAWNRAPCWHKDRGGSYLGWRPKLGMESCPLLALQAPVCVNPVA